MKNLINKKQALIKQQVIFDYFTLLNKLVCLCHDKANPPPPSPKSCISLSETPPLPPPCDYIICECSFSCLAF